MDSKLKKIDDNGRVLLETNDFRQVFKNVPAPAMMYDRDGLVYLYDPKTGLSAFDYYGALKSNIPLKNISDLQVIDKNTITGRDSSHILVYKPAALQLYQYRFSRPVHEFTKIHFTAKHLYGLSKNGDLEIYNIQ